MNLDLSLQFKEKELANTKYITLTNLQMLLLNDISFSVIIYIWYILFAYNVISGPNPFFALSITLLQNIILFIYLLNKKNTLNDLIKYTILLIILKLLPLILLYVYDKISISYFDVYSTIYLYILYIFAIILIYNIFLHKNIDVIKTMNDEVKKDYKENIMDVVYDKSYNEVIKQII